MPYRRNLWRLSQLATTEDELAVCLPFAADLLAQSGEQQRAVQLLALAFRYPAVADGWISRLSELVNLHQALRKQLPTAEFDRAWAQGQALDLHTTVAELRTL